MVSSLVVPLALGTTACGGGSHTRSLDSGIADDRPIADLSQAEVTQLCEAMGEFFAAAQDDLELRRATCIFQVLGSHTTSTPEACETAVSACAAEPSPGDVTVDCSTVTPLPECDALVGDFEVCATDQVNAFSDALGSLDCSLAGSPDLDAMLEASAPTTAPASCAPVVEDPGCRTEPPAAG